MLCTKQNREHKLSGENRVHFAEGFIQVPVADSKELYGIKFKNVVQGEEFYMKMVNALGKGRGFIDGEGSNWGAEIEIWL